MRVLATYVNNHLRPEAYRALVKYVPIGQLEMINTHGNVSRYWHEFRRRWIGEYDLMTVEQDNVITAETIPSFNACEEPWCTYMYKGPHSMPDRDLKAALGCTRFSAALQRAIPANEISDKDYFSWHLLDYRINVLLTGVGLQPHVHGEIEHLHAYDDDSTSIAKDRMMRNGKAAVLRAARDKLAAQKELEAEAAERKAAEE
jgi:hypothetical protein